MRQDLKRGRALQPGEQRPELLLNNPLLALVFLEKDVQERIRYQLGRHEPDFGPTSTSSRGSGAGARSIAIFRLKSVFWIDVETGRIAQVELVLIA